MNEVWIGIDPSMTATGVGVVGQIEGKNGRPRPRLAISQVIKVDPKLPRMERVANIQLDIQRRIGVMLRECDGLPNAIAIEKPFVGPNARASLELYGLYAVICDRLLEAQCGGIFEVTTFELKKFLGAKTKEFAVRQAFRKFGFTGESTDAIDALSLAMLAWSLTQEKAAT